MKKIRFLFILLVTWTLSGNSAPPSARPTSPSVAKATFAGGCFWCMEPPFESLPGIKSVISGYAGGSEKKPTYEQVSTGKTGHVEAVQITFDPTLISYEFLLEVFWMNVNPTDAGGQFVDRGKQYATAIFTHNDEQKRLANFSKLFIKKFFKKPIVTPVKKFTTFYPAEDYHQDYYKKSLISKAKYKYYRARSGRDDFLNKYWEKNKLLIPYDKDLVPKDLDGQISKLTPLQKKVIISDGTEPAFKNQYWDNKKPGSYQDRLSGENLFTSKSKFKSGTGWPSFTRPASAKNIVYRVDSKFGMERIEVRSRYGNAHLGHVFDDGPAPTSLRYCINSAALQFTPKSSASNDRP